MKTRTLLAARWLSVALVLCGVPALVLSQGRRHAPPADPVTGPVHELVLAVPFHLEESYVHAWRKESFPVEDGLLLVLSVDPEYARARETAEPVLLVGEETAERVNHGGESGRVVAIVPSHGTAPGSALAAGVLAPVWFASPELPERVDAPWVAAAWAALDRATARTFTAVDIAHAATMGGDALFLANRAELDALAAELVIAHSPEDLDLALRLKAPLAR